MPRKPTDETQPETDATPEPTKKRRPRVSIMERRLQNPFGEPSADIRLKDRGMVPRWFNEAARPGQIGRALELGWEPVTEDMVTDLHKIGFYTLGPGKTIVRGERQQEHLMYMPREDRDAVQEAKTRENNRRMASPNAQKQEALEAYGSANPLGAEFMDERVSLHANITTNRERIQRTGELE